MELRSFQEFVEDFAEASKVDYSTANSLICQKIKECGLKQIDIMIFINAVQLNYTCLEIAESLEISEDSVRYRLKKVREKFPQLRTFNSNLKRIKSFKAPKHFSRPYKEAVENHETFDENKHCKIDKKFRQRNLSGCGHDYLTDPNDTDNDIVKEF